MRLKQQYQNYDNANYLKGIISSWMGLFVKKKQYSFKD